jgi:hypothetical protein
MTFTYEVARNQPLDALVIIKVPSRHIPAVRRILNLLAVPEVGPGGGHGFIVADGEISISGSFSACEQAARAVLRHLNGPDFRRADEIYAERKRGAMPV